MRMNFDDPKTFICNCGSEYMHHDDIEIFCRVEDAAKGNYFKINGRDGSLALNSDLKENPSSRRGGLRIKFWCEGCEKFSFLEIAQHKGMSIFKMGREILK